MLLSMLRTLYSQPGEQKPYFKQGVVIRGCAAEEHNFRSTIHEIAHYTTSFPVAEADHKAPFRFSSYLPSCGL